MQKISIFFDELLKTLNSSNNMIGNLDVQKFEEYIIESCGSNEEKCDKIFNLIRYIINFLKNEKVSDDEIANIISDACENTNGSFDYLTKIDDTSEYGLFNFSTEEQLNAEKMNYDLNTLDGQLSYKSYLLKQEENNNLNNSNNEENLYNIESDSSDTTSTSYDGGFNFDIDKFKDAYKCLANSNELLENEIGPLISKIEGSDESTISKYNIEEDGSRSNDVNIYKYGENSGLEGGGSLEYRMWNTLNMLGEIDVEHSKLFDEVADNIAANRILTSEDDATEFNTFRSKLEDIKNTIESSTSTNEQKEEAYGLLGTVYSSLNVLRGLSDSSINIDASNWTSILGEVKNTVLSIENCGAAILTQQGVTINDSTSEGKILKNWYDNMEKEMTNKEKKGNEKSNEDSYPSEKEMYIYAMISAKAYEEASESLKGKYLNNYLNAMDEYFETKEASGLLSHSENLQWIIVQDQQILIDNEGLYKDMETVNTNIENLNGDLEQKDLEIEQYESDKLKEVYEHIAETNLGVYGLNDSYVKWALERELENDEKYQELLNEKNEIINRGEEYNQQKIDIQLSINNNITKLSSFDEITTGMIDSYDIKENVIYDPNSGQIKIIDLTFYSTDEFGNKTEVDATPEQIALYFAMTGQEIPSQDIPNTTLAEIKDVYDILVSKTSQEDLKVLAYYDKVYQNKEFSTYQIDMMIDNIARTEGKEEAMRIFEKMANYQSIASNESGDQNIIERAMAEIALFGMNTKQGIWDNGIVTHFEGYANLFETSGRMDASDYKNMYLVGKISEDLPKFYSGYYEFMSSLGNMLPAIAMNFIPYVGPIISSVAFGLSAAGNSKKQALQMGYTIEQANVYGLLIGTSEAVLQRFIGKVPGLSNIEGMALSPGLKGLAFRMLGEGNEEGLQEILNPLFFAIAGGVNNDYLLATVDGKELSIKDVFFGNNTLNWEGVNIEDVWHSWKMGAMMGGFFGVGKTSLDYYSKLKTGNFSTIDTCFRINLDNIAHENSVSNFSDLSIGNRFSAFMEAFTRTKTDIENISKLNVKEISSAIASDPEIIKTYEEHNIGKNIMEQVPFENYISEITAVTTKTIADNSVSSDIDYKAIEKLKEQVNELYKKSDIKETERNNYIEKLNDKNLSPEERLNIENALLKAKEELAQIQKDIKSIKGKIEIPNPETVKLDLPELYNSIAKELFPTSHPTSTIVEKLKEYFNSKKENVPTETVEYCNYLMQKYYKLQEELKQVNEKLKKYDSLTVEERKEAYAQIVLDLENKNDINNRINKLMEEILNTNDILLEYNTDVELVSDFIREKVSLEESLSQYKIQLENVINEKNKYNKYDNSYSQLYLQEQRINDRINEINSKLEKINNLFNTINNDVNMQNNLDLLDKFKLFFNSAILSKKLDVNKIVNSAKEMVQKYNDILKDIKLFENMLEKINKSSEASIKKYKNVYENIIEKLKQEATSIKSKLNELNVKVLENPATNTTPKTHQYETMDEVIKNLKYQINEIETLINIVNEYHESLKNGKSLYSAYVRLNTNGNLKALPSKKTLYDFYNRFVRPNKNYSATEYGHFIHCRTRNSVYSTKSAPNKLYINADYDTTLKFIQLFVNKCEELGIPFYFKTAAFDFKTGNVEFLSSLERDESLVIYAQDEYLLDYINICKEIRDTHPELTFNRAPALSAAIDEFIGYGNDIYSSDGRPIQSYNQFITNQIKDAIAFVDRQYVNKYKASLNQIFTNSKIIEQYFYDVYLAIKQNLLNAGVNIGSSGNINSGATSGNVIVNNLAPPELKEFGSMSVIKRSDGSYLRIEYKAKRILDGKELYIYSIAGQNIYSDMDIIEEFKNGDDYKKNYLANKFLSEARIAKNLMINDGYLGKIYYENGLYKALRIADRNKSIVELANALEKYLDNIRGNKSGEFGVNQNVAESLLTYNFDLIESTIAELQRRYNINENNLLAILNNLDTVGACSYARVANCIFSSYLNKEDQFLKDFGYPMYHEINGRIHLNSNTLITDLYIYCNLSVSGGKLFSFDSKTGEIILHNQFLSADKDFIKNNQIYLSTAHGINITTINNFLESHKVDNEIVSTPIKSFGSTLSTEHIQIIKNELIEGNQILMGIYYNEKSPQIITMKNLDGGPDVKTCNWGEGSGHAVFVAGVRDDGIIVSSWGKKYLIEFSDLKDFNSTFFVSKTIKGGN